MDKKIETTNKTNKSDTYGEAAWSILGITIMTILSVIGTLFTYFWITKDSTDKLPGAFFALIVATIIMVLIYLLVLRIWRYFSVDSSLKKIKQINLKLREGQYTAKMNIKGLSKGSSLGEAMEEFNLLSDSLEEKTKEEINYIKEIINMINPDDSTNDDLSKKIKELEKLNKIKEIKLTAEKKSFNISSQIIETIKNKDERIKQKDLRVDTDIDEKVLLINKEAISEILINELVNVFVENTEDGGITINIFKQKPDVVIKITSTQKKEDLAKNFKVIKTAVKELNGQMKLTQEEFETFLIINIPLK